MAVFGQWTKGDAQLLINEDEPSPRKDLHPVMSCHIAAIGQKWFDGWKSFPCFFLRPGNFSPNYVFCFIGSFSTKELFPFCGEDTSQPSRTMEPGRFFWDILGSHKGKAADREVTINSCPKCLLQQFLLSVLLKMSWRRFIWASRFQKLLSFF